MNLFGLSITRAEQKSTAVAAMSPRQWWPLIQESFAGAWQRNVVLNRTEVLAFSAVFACVTLIAADISKNRVKLVERDDEGIWTEINSSAFSPVLAKPNHYQNRISFFESWMLSKLIHGNTYVLKERDQRGVVVALYVLDPMRCRPLVAPDGSIFYQLGTDLLSGVDGAEASVPASEIIHDRMCTLFHPLCGVSPIFACGLSASQGLNIQSHSSRFFANSARPGGVLTAPGMINQVTADRIKGTWETNFSGENVGRVAVLGDGLKFETMSMTAEAAQMIEQLKLSVETVCSAFHVPGFLIGAAAVPPHGNIEALWQLYYIQCLQSHIESIELCLDEGLGLTDVPGKVYGTEFDIANLLRMDTATAIQVAKDGVAGSVFTPDEARARFDLPKLPGGDTIYMQQQNYSLAALAKRDAQADPFGTATKPTSSSPAPTGGGETKPAIQVDPEADKDFIEFLMIKELRSAA